MKNTPLADITNNSSLRTKCGNPPVSRICCVCRTSHPKTDLIRVARIDGAFVVDQAGNSNGRGAYVCPQCIEKCIKTRALNRSFKTQVPQAVYDVLNNLH